MYPAISTGAFFPSSVAKTSLPLDEGQRTGHSCRLLTYRGTHTHAQREGGKEGERPGEEPKPPCAGPPAGLPERPEAGSRRAGAPRSGRAPPPGEGPAGPLLAQPGRGGGPRFPIAGGLLARQAGGSGQSGGAATTTAPTHTHPQPPAPGRVGSGRRYLQSPSSRSRVPFMSRMRLARAGTGCMARSSSSQRATSAYMARMLRSAASPRLSTPSR